MTNLDDNALYARLLDEFLALMGVPRQRVSLTIKAKGLPPFDTDAALKALAQYGFVVEYLDPADPRVYTAIPDLAIVMQFGVVTVETVANLLTRLAPAA